MTPGKLAMPVRPGTRSTEKPLHIKDFHAPTASARFRNEDHVSLEDPYKPRHCGRPQPGTLAMPVRF